LLEQLECHSLVGLDVPRGEDLAHAPRAELAFDQVVA
jgi:hypothetical protein